MGVGVARFISWNTWAQMKVVVKPRAIWCCQLEEEMLDIGQQSRFVLIEGKGGGGVLAHSHQQAINDPGAID